MTTQSRDERYLIAEAAGGNRLAFDILVRTHYRGVYGLALRVLGNQDDAADATQTTFLKALRSIGEFDTSRPMKPWLYRICANVCTDIVRSKHRSHDALDQHAHLLESADDTEDHAEQSELQGKVLRAISRLPERYRKIIMMRHYEQLDVEEIAQKVGAPEGTIKSWLFRARAQLRRELASVLEPTAA